MKESPPSESAFEKTLAEQPLAELPPDWREKILGTAAAGLSGGKAGSPAPPRLWDLLGTLLPRPLLIPVAAAWLLILLLKVATPDVENTIQSSRTSESRTAGSSAALVAWAERVKVLSHGGTDCM